MVIWVMLDLRETAVMVLLVSTVYRVWFSMRFISSLARISLGSRCGDLLLSMFCIFSFCKFFIDIFS